MKQQLLILLGLVLLSAAQLRAETPIVTAESTKADPLTVPYRAETITIDGQGTDSVWKDVPALTHFKYYWNPETPPKTELRLFYNDTDLCFLYTVEDSDVVCHPMISEEMDIADEDRIEFGLSPEDPLAPYYFFEIDSMGRVLDYESRYYRHFDDTWDFDGLQVLGRRTETGYQVEGTFSLQGLRDLGVIRPDGKFLAGFFRGEYISLNDDDKNHKWISWVYSETAHADFHIHSAFGTVQLEPK